MASLIAGPALWLLAYALLYWFALFAFVWIHSLSGARLAVHTGRQDRGSVLVLVPSHHEGEGLVDTVRTLIDQDYAGPIELQVLVEDFSDETVFALSRAYGERINRDGVLELDIREPQRTVSVVAVGDNAKHAKLNYALERAKADYIALLDADHRARPARHAEHDLEHVDRLGHAHLDPLGVRREAGVRHVLPVRERVLGAVVAAARFGLLGTIVR